MNNAKQSRTRGWVLWPVIHRADSRFIGFCGFGEEDNSEVGMGWRLLPEYWGQGLATEAAAATLQHGFATWGFSHVVAYVQKPNAASIRVMEKIGMISASPKDAGIKQIIVSVECDGVTSGDREDLLGGLRREFEGNSPLQELRLR